MTVKTFILDETIDKSEEGIITGTLDIIASMDLRASLTIDNRARMAILSIIEFATETLRI